MIPFCLRPQLRSIDLHEISDTELLECIASVDQYLIRSGCADMNRADYYLDMRFIWARELHRRAGARAFLKTVFFSDYDS